MDFAEVAALGDEIVLLGRIAARLGFSIKDSNFRLNRSEIEICRVIAMLSRELGCDKIPMSLVFRIVPALEASVSRTIGSLEFKGYIKKSYARDKGEKILKELRQGLIDNILKTYKKRSKGRS